MPSVNNTPEKPGSATGLLRIWRAFFYSLSGFRLAFRDEAAFRQELLLVGLLSALCLYLPLAHWLKVVILFSHVIVLIVELLNTTVETIVDKVSPEFSLEAKKAKDTGSSAVLLSLVLSVGIWGYAIYSLL